MWKSPADPPYCSPSGGRISQLISGAAFKLRALPLSPSRTLFLRLMSHIDYAKPPLAALCYHRHASFLHCRRRFVLHRTSSLYALNPRRLPLSG